MTLLGRALAGVWTLAMPALGPDSGLLAVAVLTAAAVLFALLAAARTTPLGPAPLHALSTALRAQSRQARYIPLRDPDAAGRPRPRAPGQR
ncbi:hypothetical protein Kfla_3430 [Kribbella flavida DSM 17836]|uniref:Uncharacterized protein n=1 Tax=Kribbella flavida (strain DSM 17836 / JCM 10339 / NBRC 14399) TaxID=479435 RepID=D2PLQ8_KRIFD|nr:DUF6412 domain-containing protein [Kribbella flavida]ADB32488.1 hypothetical protein Kfla_3430 [Kribbella flavida DSM 17836]